MFWGGGPSHKVRKPHKLPLYCVDKQFIFIDLAPMEEILNVMIECNIVSD